MQNQDCQLRLSSVECKLSVHHSALPIHNSAFNKKGESFGFRLPLPLALYLIARIPRHCEPFICPAAKMLQPATHLRPDFPSQRAFARVKKRGLTCLGAPETIFSNPAMKPFFRK
jgi:hypothetical protein